MQTKQETRVEQSVEERTMGNIVSTKWIIQPRRLGYHLTDCCIESVVGLQPAGGWKIKSLQPNDQSIGAFLFLIRNLRNELIHGSVSAVSDLQAFKQLRARMENILLGLKYKNMQMFYDLESCPLDKHVLVISRMVTNLDQEVDLLRNEASDNSHAIKNIEQTNQWIKSYLKQLSSAKADKTDVEDLAKSMENRMNAKADKDELDGMFVYVLLQKVNQTNKKSRHN
ncbi:uncharacterized protein [Clytia hemisphaerica]|uniref:uncharacterized protein n=1 Tax=Clytia hemisphaerica TaxID=252671 RepID=UPI0034D3F766